MRSLICFILGILIGHCLSRFRHRKSKNTIVTQIAGDNSKMTGIVNNYSTDEE